MTIQVETIAPAPYFDEEITAPITHPLPARAEPPARTAVSTRFVDFWLMGGASILVWIALCVAQGFRYDSPIIQSRILQLGPLFSILSIFCNHPHFMISYRFGYGRGASFVLRHWIRLVFVPLALVALYAIAYLKFDTAIDAWPSVLLVNSWLETIGLTYRFGTLSNLGTEILSFSILLMNLTVGWHYSKQVFGCMMAYSRFDAYPITPMQRSLIKASVLSVASFNFFFMSIYAPEYNDNALKQGSFFNIPVLTLGLPTFLIPASAVIVAVLAATTIVGVYYLNYRNHRRWPSANFLIAWIAFYIWWIPAIRQTEFYFLAIPFFHSLQYLPFAYRLEEPRLAQDRRREIGTSVRLALLLAVGFAAFELVPTLLDEWNGSRWFMDVQFFLVTFAVFINIQHFFIDSVVWKFDQREVRQGIFGGKG